MPTNTSEGYAQSRRMREATRDQPSAASHRVGADALHLIRRGDSDLASERAGVAEVDAVLDASFIKAWIIRVPESNKVDPSDSDTRVARNGSGFRLGYKLHASVEPERIPRRPPCLRRRMRKRRSTIHRFWIGPERFSRSNGGAVEEGEDPPLPHTTG